MSLCKSKPAIQTIRAAIFRSPYCLSFIKNYASLIIKHYALSIIKLLPNLSRNLLKLLWSKLKLWVREKHVFL